MFKYYKTANVLSALLLILEKKMIKSIKILVGSACVLTLLLGGVVQAKKVTIRVQSVIPSKADEVVMLKQFGSNVVH